MEIAGWCKSFLLGRGMWLWVHAGQGFCQGDALLQALPPRNVIDMLVRLRRTEPTATLRLVLKSTDGGPPGEFEISLLQTRLNEPGDGPFIPERTDRGMICRWAPGHYRVEASPKPVVMDYGWFDSFEADVELRADEETVLERKLEPGGRLRFCVHLPDAADRREIERFALSTPALGPVTLGLHNFIRKRADDWVNGRQVFAGESIQWRPLLPPGRHVLTVKSRDYADTVTSVTIEPRKVTDVDIWLQAR